MRNTILRCWFCIAVLFPLLARGQQVTVLADHESGVYGIGEPIKWSIRWTADAAPATLTYSVKKGGLTQIQSGTIDLAKGNLADGAATSKSTFESKLESKLDSPGTLLLEVKTKSPEGKEIRGLAGAVAAPDQIQPSAARPADFDAFWEAKINQLQSVPSNPQLAPAPGEKENVDYWKITLDNIHGTHINGQLAKPTKGEKFPAMLIVQWAGVYGLQKSWVTDRASEGWLALNIEPHDLPIDEPESFYKSQFDGPLKDYWSIGNDDRDSSYFLRMYLSCYRAADYLASRPDWDGKTLVVIGGSQGGLQSLMTAAIYPKITAAMAIVPAGCDMRGPDVGRAPGWPHWYSNVGGKDPAKVRQASEYFDVVNFASRIKCPVIIGGGLIDETCPPEGILAACNQITSPKEMIILPRGDHPNTNNSHDPYTKRCWGEWLPVLVKGKPAPVASGNVKSP